MHSEFVSLALVIRTAMRMFLIQLLFLVCPDLTYFTTLSHRLSEFNKNIIENKMFALTLSKNLSTTFLV